MGYARESSLILGAIHRNVEPGPFDLKRWFELPILFSRFRPMVFCVETITYTQNNTEKKLTEINDLMRSKNYKLYAGKYINTIYVCSVAWEKRPIYN